MRSISARLYWSILTVCLIVTVAMASLVIFLGKDLEDTIVEVSFSSERDYIIQNFTHAGVYIWDTQSQMVAFIPNGMEMPPHMPAALRTLTEGKVHEFKVDDQIFMGKRQELDTGVLYFAKNITLFEEREYLFERVLLVVVVLIFALSALLSYFSSQRIVKPWRKLAYEMSAVPVGKNMPLIVNSFQEAELYTIAQNFNQFLGELNAYVKRENSLLSLASHELRTPIAVMAGALDIIESRQQLSEKDVITLKRIRQSCTEMQVNVETLLKLARKQGQSIHNEVFLMQDVLEQVKDDLQMHLGADRVQICHKEVADKVAILNDVFLSKMLVRNLVQNALQHTSGTVQLILHADYLDVIDEGSGLNLAQQKILQGLDKDISGEHGFGLYIVTMLSERLAWPVEIAQTPEQGSLIRVHFSKSRYYL